MTLRLRAVFVVVLVFFIFFPVWYCLSHKPCLFHIHVPYVMRTTKAYISCACAMSEKRACRSRLVVMDVTLDPKFLSLKRT